MNAGKRAPATGIVFLALLILMVFMAGSAGCIKLAQKTISGEPTPTTAPAMTGTPMFTPAEIPQSTPTTVPIPVLTPAKTDLVTEVTADVTPSPYLFPNATPINATPDLPAYQYRTPEFTKTYPVNSTNPIGLMVNVVQPPLYIVYTVDPVNDCLKDPDSCRGLNPSQPNSADSTGTSINSVNNPYMTITVRDNQTGCVVAQDGYGRIYSSDIGHYIITYTGVNLSTSVNGKQKQDYVFEPGPRYIAVYKGGQYQITITGDYLDVTVSIITGSSPNPLDATEKSNQGSTPTISPTPPEGEGEPI